MKSTAGPASGIAGTVFGLVLGLAAALVLFPFGFGGPDVREGDRAPRTYRALRAAQYESEVITEQRRDQEAAAVEDVYFPRDPAVAERQLIALRNMLNEFERIRGSNLAVSQKLQEVQNIPGAQVIRPEVLTIILDFPQETFDDFRDRVERGLMAIMNDDVHAEDIAGKVNNYLEADVPLPGSAGELVAVRQVLNAFVVQNVEVDRQATERARAEARARVSPVIITWAPGQVVVQEGERLDEEDIEALEETGIISPAFDPYRAFGAAVVGVGVALLAGGGAMSVATFGRPVHRKLIVIGATFVVAMIAARVGFPAIFPDRERLFLAFAIPFAAVAMVSSVLAGFSFAAIMSVATGMLAAFVAAVVPDLPGSRFSGPLESLELSVAVTVAGIAAAPFVARSHGVLRYGAAAIACIAGIGAVLGAVWLFSEPRAETDVLWAAGAASVHGAGGALLAGALLSVTGRWAGIAPATRLRTLSRGDHPLLRRLQDEAPGTYHHSMMVATLAESAARRIGVDAELARVGAMFHDVGKLAQPRYYVENTVEGEESPHSQLLPEESAARIREHVSNGLLIARAAGLPDEVARFIPEHHGTRLILYFYREALRESPVVDVEAFRYAGPKPQSKETAIVMLADSCEATVRANRSDGPDEIDRTVDQVIAERTQEGELDESGLSVRDVRVIAATFKESLRALHHRRITYPPPMANEIAEVAELAGS